MKADIRIEKSGILFEDLIIDKVIALVVSYHASGVSVVLQPARARKVRFYRRRLLYIVAFFFLAKVVVENLQVSFDFGGHKFCRTTSLLQLSKVSDLLITFLAPSQTIKRCRIFSFTGRRLFENVRLLFFDSF